MHKKNSKNLADKMQSSTENQSDVGSDFERADLADFDDKGQQERQSNMGRDNPLDSIFGHSTGASEWGNIQNELAKAQMIALQNKCALLEEKYALVEEKMKNMKLEGMLKEGEDNKKIKKLERDLVASQQNVEELKEAFSGLAKENKCALLEFAKKLEEMSREGMAKEEKENKQIESMQKKMEEANKRAGEDKIAHNQQIEQLKRDLMANQQKMAELAKATAAKKWKLCNSRMNRWDGTGTEATISADGLSASIGDDKWMKVFAVIPFSFYVNQHENDGIHIKYYEVKTDRRLLRIGLSADKNDRFIGSYANSFAICPFDGVDCYWSSDSVKKFESPLGATLPTINEEGRSNVIGCGVLAWPDGKLSIFFTANGTLLGNVPISTGVPLYPAVTLWPGCTVKANFGDNLAAIPFEYDITNCAGLNLDKQ